MSESMSVGDMLADQMDRLFESTVTHIMLSAVEEGEFPAALWSEIEEMGVVQALVPDSADGAGLPWAEMVSLFRCLGRRALPLPLGETIVGRGAIGAAGLRIPPGPLAVVGECLALDGADRLTGHDSLVPWVPHARHAVAVGFRDGVCHLCLVALDAAGLLAETVGGHSTLARIPGAALHFDQVKPVQVATVSLGELGLLPQLATLRSAQMAGALERLLALCVDYGNTRTQFGKPIGKFQAIQHLIAELAELSAAVQVAARIGCHSIDRGDGERGAAIAKCRAGAAATRGAAIGHQVFGAMGVTDEHELHFLTRRLWQWGTEAKSGHWWAERLGRSIVANHDGLWEALTA